MPSVRINNIKQYKAYIICKNRKNEKKDVENLPDVEKCPYQFAEEVGGLCSFEVRIG